MVDFIGVGTTKSASTWIFKCLAEHPQICGSTKKEIGFFSDPYLFKRGISWYLNHFRHCKPGQICGAFTPGYIEFPDAAQRIKDTFPHVKIISVFRNPIDKLYSLYWFNKFDGRGSFVNFDSFEDILDPALGIIDTACSGKQLAEYYRIFPKEQIHTLLYDDIQKDPEKVMRNLYTFLGVDPTFVAPSTHAGVNETEEGRIRWVWLHKIIFGLFWRLKRIPWIYRLIKKFDTQALLRFLFAVNVVHKPRNGDKFQKPPMNPETRKKLQEFFAADNRLLGQLIGRDLSEWK